MARHELEFSNATAILTRSEYSHARTYTRIPVVPLLGLFAFACEMAAMLTVE